MTFEDFLSRLEGVKGGAAGYSAICPAHDDRSASLSVKEGDEGILVKCHANCPTQAIVEAIGLGMRDLFYAAREKVDFATPEAVYDYTDEAGNLLFQTLRFPGKSFRQRHPGPDGEWVWNLEDVRRVLYRLPEILAAVARQETIFITEGEKDAEAIWAAGYPATCNPMGAGKWRDEFSESLRGAYVVIVQDRDDPGRAHANRVKESLIGVANRVWVVQARSGKDASDHLAAGHSVSEFDQPRLLPQHGVYTATHLAEMASERLHLRESDLPAYDPLGNLSRHLTFRPGRMYIVGGYTGDGKTALALQTTRALCEEHVKVGYFSLEMAMSDLLNRLMEHKGIPLWLLERPWEIPKSQYASVYDQAVKEIGSWGLDIMWKPSADSDYIVEQTMNGEYDFVIIDHIHRFSWGKERRKLEDEIGKLTNLALDFNIPVLVLAQLRRFTRGHDMENYPRPLLQDFRETEAFGNESARAMAVWRIREPNGITYTEGGMSEIITLKDRHGPLGSAIVWFDGEKQLFMPSPLKPAAAEVDPVSQVHSEALTTWSGIA